jgi:uroporphyrinogen III methyltransferase/synthase
MAFADSPKPHEDSAVLSGKRIVVTRARIQAGELARRLVALGAQVVDFPTIEIVPPNDFGPLDRAIEELETYQWLFFTSVNGVDSFFSRLRLLRKGIQALENLRVVAIGSETARRLESEGIRVDFVPAKFQAEGIIEGLKSAEVRDSRILIPRAAKAREILPAALRQWGAWVDVVEAYKTVLPENCQVDLRKQLQQRRIDMITFTSSSTVSNFALLFAGHDLAELLEGITIACIGPITGQTVIDHGLRAEVVATEFTIPGLVEAILNHYQSAR